MKRNAYFILVLSILLLYYGISGLFVELADNSGLIEAEGRIVALHERNAAKGAALHPVVTFRDESGKEITFTSKSGSNYFKNKVGEVIEVVYPEGFPEEARLKSSLSRGMSPVLFLLSGTVLFVIWFAEAYKNFK